MKCKNFDGTRDLCFIGINTALFSLFKKNLQINSYSRTTYYEQLFEAVPRIFFILSSDIDFIIVLESDFHLETLLSSFFFYFLILIFESPV